MQHGTTGRFRSALDGEPVDPVAEGLTFVDPALLPGPGGPPCDPAAALARACADLRLDFAFVPSWEPWAPDAVTALRAAGVAALWVAPGVFTPALDRLGALEALRMVARDRGRLAATLDEALELADRAAVAGLAAGADALVVADDLAGAGGPIVSPAYLGAEVFPRLAALASRASDAGVPALLHCDGVADSLHDAVRAAGFVAVHGDHGGAGRLETALASARATGLTLLGGVATADLTDPMRAAAAGASAATLAARAGLLVCDDGGVSTRAECVALFAALGAARR